MNERNSNPGSGRGPARPRPREAAGGDAQGMTPRSGRSAAPGREGAALRARRPHVRRAQRERQPARARAARAGAAARATRVALAVRATGRSSPRSSAARAARRLRLTPSTGTSPPTRRRTSSTTARRRRSSPTPRSRTRGARPRCAPTCDVRLAVGGAIAGFESLRRRARAPRTAATSTTRRSARTMLYTSGTTGRPKGVHRGATTPDAARARRR